MHRLSDGAILRAEDLAAEFGVSVRSIYRDMDRLKASGLPIKATQGAGYQAEAVTTLPPLHISDHELEALHLGLLAVAASADDVLRSAAQSLSDKLEAAVPADGTPPDPALAVYPFEDAGQALQHLSGIRSAVRSRQRLRITLRSGTLDDIRPLKLDYWARIWTLIGYSDTRAGFVKVPVDAISNVTVLPGLFVAEEGKRLEDTRQSDITSLR
jgi:predicted DNA-binding transcriptional regulator YafY